MIKEIRVRFAPSPTGPLHIGGVRTALYNYLFAKNRGGKFILRIEDTDQGRLVEGAENYIIDALKWLNIFPDESPLLEGKYGPYRQSERKLLYKEYADRLVEEGNAYLAFDTPQEIEETKKVMQAEGNAKPQYDVSMRGRMRNSITMTKDEVDESIGKGIPYVVRIKIPERLTITFEDAVRGNVSVKSEILDDKVLMKSDGMPTYHLANVVDDYLMKISHVIRGEEWLPSAPLHVLMYKLLGWESEMPTFAHLPLILKPDGKGKLSKRDSQKSGIPVFPIEWKDSSSDEVFIGFKESGYLPSALVNFLSFLGWNPGTEQEIFSMDQLTEIFNLDRIVKGGARFDIEKAKWYNEQYLRNISNSGLAKMVLEEVDGEITKDINYLENVVALMKERVSFPLEIYEEGIFMFKPPETYDEKVVRKKWTMEVVVELTAYAEMLQKVSEISAFDAKITLERILEKGNLHLGHVMQPLRVAITGRAGGPDLMEIIHLLGPMECVKRLENAIERLPTKD